MLAGVTKSFTRNSAVNFKLSDSQKQLEHGATLPKVLTLIAVHVTICRRISDRNDT